MSPRHQRLRKVINPPQIKGYKPYGPEMTRADATPVILLYEEYEALRLCDYDQMNHHRASVEMEVSRPTFTRIYAQARRKIATAFVEGRPMAIEGGKVYFDSDWYHCHACLCHFNNPEREVKIEQCPLCGSQKIDNIDSSQEKESDEEDCHKYPCGKGRREHRKGKTMAKSNHHSSL